MERNARRTRIGRRGNVMIEFAVVVPLMVLLFVVSAVMTHSVFERLVVERALAAAGRYVAATDVPGARVSHGEVRAVYDRALAGGENDSRSLALIGRTQALRLVVCPAIDSACPASSPFATGQEFYVLEVSHQRPLEKMFRRLTDGAAISDAFSRKLIVPRITGP